MKNDADSIRKITTGYDRKGRACVVSDELLTIASQTSIWAADMAPTLPGGVNPPFVGPLVPAPGGVNVLVLTLPPYLDRGTSAMHETPTVDCLMQLSGESLFVMEDTQLRLTPGDWLICNGVIHDWRNDLAVASVLIGIVYGAHKL